MLHKIFFHEDSLEPVYVVSIDGGSKPHKKWRANTTIVDSFHSTTIKKKTGITENAASICARKLSDVDDDDGLCLWLSVKHTLLRFLLFYKHLNCDFTIYFYANAIWRFIIPTKWDFSKESIANFMAHLILVSSFLFLWFDYFSWQFCFWHCSFKYH